MSERTRDFLKPEFRDGERPSGTDFADLIDSFVNKQTDGVRFDADRNLVLSRGVQLGDSNGTAAGGLRFNSNQLQVFTGGTWVNVASGGGGGGFQAPPTVAPTPVVHDGNVGIGNFPTPAALTFRLEVPLAANNGPGNQVRFGNVVCANGAGLNAQDQAVFAHQQQAATNLVNSGFALRQSPAGQTQLNAPASQTVSIVQGGVSVRLGISTPGGNVIVAGDTDLPAAAPNSKLQVQGNAHIQGDITATGQAFKTVAGAWLGISDARTKEDVRDLELGLSDLRQVRPVRFRYNGRAGTTAGQAGVGVLGQEIETVVPETIQRRNVTNDPGLDDMRVFDPSALTFVLINAVKELAARVEHLEQALAVATAHPDSAPVIA
jgi:endosialidase-like protein